MDRRRFLASFAATGASVLAPWANIIPLPVGGLASSFFDPALSRKEQRATATAGHQGHIRFVEVAPQAGVTATDIWGGVRHKRFILETKGNGIAFLDYDNDGWLDIYLSNGTRLDGLLPGEHPTGHLYHNNRDGTFTDITAGSGLALTGWQTGVCVGDYDNDGWDDLLLIYWGQNRLLHNNHDGTFTDVTKQAGLEQNRVRWGSGCAFLDYDRDGFLDIFIANYVDFDLKDAQKPGAASNCFWKGMPVLCGPRGLPSGQDVLYHNNGDGTFTDVSEQSGIAAKKGNSIGVVSYDFDNDGWPDIYVANDSTPSFLFHNNHNGTFKDIGEEAGVALSDDGYEQGGMGVAVGDYDQDGWFDIFKTNFADDTPNLYHSNGDGTFTDMVLQAGLGKRTDLVSWGAGFVDVDNDGWKDIFYVNGHVYPEVDQYHMNPSYRQPRLLYRNLGDGRFADVSSQSGPAFQERYSSRGCAFGDFNNDGKMDILIGNMNDPPSLWRNETETSNSAVLIKLIGTRSNRNGIGARVRVLAGGHHQMDEVHSGDSVMSMSDMRLHFGLGQEKVMDLVEVRWPSGLVERFHRVTANRIITIKEGLGIIRAEPFVTS
ncbi:MAG: CRTAC1 family protein [Terriglobia bacterium]